MRTAGFLRVNRGGSPDNRQADSWVRLSSASPGIERRLSSVNVTFESVPGIRDAGRLSYILVKRITRAIETENQSTGSVAIGDPDTWMLVRRVTSEACIRGRVVGVARDGWTEERDDRHLWG